MISLLRHILLALLITNSLVLSAGDVFTRIYSAEELTEDGEYVIGAMGFSNPRFFICGSNMVGIDYSASPTEKLTDVSQALVFNIIYNGDQIIFTHHEQYLCAKSTKTSLEFSTQNHTPWRITVQNGDFKLYFGDKCLRINSYTTKASTFGLYSSSSKEATLVIYKRSIPLSQMNSYKRCLEADRWETLCLPFSAALPSGVEAYEVSDHDGTTLSYTAVTSLQAGLPYIIQSKASQIVTFSNNGGSHATVPSSTATGFTGTFIPITRKQGFLLNGKQFVPATSGSIVPAFRCYFTY